ncbi:MAG: response regulator [Spirochaetales bacterium]|nr:response regulator [Spirochaetales bacterium]
MNEKFFKVMFEESSLGMILLSNDGIILKCNSELCGILKTDIKDIEQNSVLKFIHSKDKDLFNNIFSNLGSSSKKKVSLEVRTIKGNNKYGWCRFNISEIACDDGIRSCKYAIVEDVTEQVLIKEQLTNAKIIAEKATKTKSEFLANMSHEIRTPIHTVIGMSELLKETRLDAEQKEYAGQIGFSAEVLLSLINDILDVEKIEAGKLKLETIEMDLLDVAHSAIDLIALQAHQKNLETVLYISPDVQHLVYGDPTRLRQVIVNLFNNAMKFTSTGEIELRINLLEDYEDKSRLIFKVRDTGIGIPEDKMNKLFKEFSQIDSSTTRKYGGTGLGLTISKKLAVLMGGEIGVESKAGEGSTFWFTAEFVKQNKRSPYLDYMNIYCGEKILVVDDNKTARHIFSSYLAELGFSVYEASGGHEAIERLLAAEQEPFLYCIIDQIMPRMDGWHLASELNALRDNEKYPWMKDLKLYLSSPAGRSADEAKMKLLNWFDGYLNKPLKKKQLYTVFTDMVTDEEPEDVVEIFPEDEEITKMKILVAEDHEVNQQLFCSILEHLGCDVILADNGLQAVKKCKEKKIDIIFMDCQMPEMNGYEATTEIRRLGYNLPIIAVTASAIKGEKEKCLSCGMSDFLTKPFKKKDIQPILRKWKGLNHDKVAATQDSAKSGEIETLEPEYAIFNFSDAVDTFLGNEATVKRLAGGYIKKVEGQIPELQNCLDEGDTERSRELAHSIKGSALNLSIEKLGEKAKLLEYSSRDGKIDESKNNFENLKLAFEEFKEYVEANNLVSV